MVSDLQLIQLRRILGAGTDLTREDAPERAAHSATTIADAFFEEAAANDDVTSARAALEYLEGRIAFFEGVIDHAGATRIRTRFSERIAAWDA